MWFTHKVCVTVDASLLLLILLLLVFFLLLVFLRDHVVQVAQVMLGEHVVHGLAHSHQCQNLQNKEVFWLDPLPRNPRVFFFFYVLEVFGFFTMTGKTMAATVDLRIQSRAKHRPWMKVKRWMRLWGTCRR